MRLGRWIDALEPRTLLASVPAGFAESAVAGGLQGPTAMAVAPDGRIFVAQQNGVIKIIHDGHLHDEPFATLATDSFGERGLLGITLDPNFEQNQYVYVFYAATTPTSHNRVSRLTANGDEVIAGSEVALLDLPPIGDKIWHMGGGLHFGIDGKLYVGVGMHEDLTVSQNLNSPFGKMLRINPDGTIPTDNPFYDQTTGINRAIWALGLRNPFTFAIQPGTGRMHINDVGGDQFEEINLGVAGANYGWSTFEGHTNVPGMTSPIHAYSHNDGCAVTGGVFYNPTVAQFPASYAGKYFFSDFCTGDIRLLDPADNAVTPFLTGGSFPTDIVVGPDGAMYYISRYGSAEDEGRGGDAQSGVVYKVEYVAPTSPRITAHPAAKTVAAGEPVSFSAAAVGAGPITYQWQRNSVDIDGATTSTHAIAATTLDDHQAQFSCVITNSLGSVTSHAATLSVINGARPTASITVPFVDATYQGGDTIIYSATGNDADDGALPASAFTWRVDLHHNVHSHPFIAPIIGQTGGSFVIPTIGEKAADVFYRITLTVTDATGLTATVHRDVVPRLASITVKTNVSGLKLRLDNTTFTHSRTVDGVIGLTRTLEAARYQFWNGIPYEFDHWSDGGAATHDISFPATTTTYTASYKPASAVYVSDLSEMSSSNFWGPIEKDKSNGEKALNDGNPITLAGVVYSKGLGAHADSEIVYQLGGSFDRFKSAIGVDDESGNAGSVVFQVFADDVKIYDSGVMRGSSATKFIDVSVAGKQVLKLVVTDAGDGKSDDHADWADARLTVAGGDGLAGTYYNTTDLSGPSVSRTDTAVDFAWGSTAPLAGISAGTYSARWTGQIQPLYSERYTLCVSADDGARLWINDVLLIDRWTTMPLAGDANSNGVVDQADFATLFANFGQTGKSWQHGDFTGDGRVDFTDFQKLEVNFGKTWPVEDAVEIELEAGQKYDVRLEYFQNGGNAQAQLLWSSASQAKQVIPQARLFTGAPVPPAAPGGVSAVAEAGKITVAWQDVAHEFGYVVERSANGVYFFEVASLASGATQFVDANLPPGARFWYRVRAFNSAGASGWSTLVDATTPNVSPAVTYLSDLTPVSANNGWGPFERDMSNGEAVAFDGELMEINGVKYAKGLGVHSSSVIVYPLNGQYAQFLADIGVDDEVSGGSVRFEVWNGTTTRLYQSPVLTGAMAAVPISVNVTGVEQLRLVVTDGGDGATQDHADWGNARVIAAPVGLAASAASSIVRPMPVFSTKKIAPAKRRNAVLT